MPGRHDSSEHESRTPPAGSITLDQRLADIDRKLDMIVETLAKGATRMAMHGIRILALEAIIYGGLAIWLGAQVLKALAKLQGDAS